MTDLPDPHHLALPEGRLATYDHGEGPTLVCVHGTPSWTWEFRHLFAAWRGRCVSVDHLGFGASDKAPGADYSVAAHQRRFAEAMDTLDVQDAVFLLHDFGTSIALPWMLAHPERVRGVVLANTFLWPATGAMRWVLALYATTLGRWLYRSANLSARFLLPWAWGTRVPLTPEAHARFLEPFPTAADRHALAALPGELVGPTLTDLERQASTLSRWPVRMVWGLADALLQPSELERWRTVLPGLQVDTVQDAGHFVADEAPDAVLKAVRALSPLEETCQATPASSHASPQPA